jgi:hypothetical protein
MYGQKIKLNGYQRKTISPGYISGKLTVLYFSHSDIQNNFWVCQCDCGNITTVRARLLRGHTNSCGCLQKEAATKHGLNNSSEVAIWRNMKYRCNNPNAANYHLYGGRGIKVCDRWLDSFTTFLEDVGRRPSKLHSLERIDNNGNYEPENVKWASKKEQARNRRDSRLITYKGITKTIIEYCEEYGMKHHQLLVRLNHGWSVEKALLTPIRKRST